eukprot:scaffold30556_cov104-Isochrysis_galbana.AAC.1
MIHAHPNPPTHTPQACTVTRGVKYSANFWLHMYEFQAALGRGCDNSDYYQPGVALTPKARRAPAALGRAAL